MAALNELDVWNAAPAVFAQKASDRMSEKYSFVRTQDIMGRIKQEGFEVVMAHQVHNPRKEDDDLGAHLIRFRHRDLLESTGDVPEIILRNSHNGDSFVDTYGGFYRFVCANGIIVGDSIGHFRAKHNTKDLMDKVIENVHQIMCKVREAQEIREAMILRELTKTDKEHLAASASELRFGKTSPIKPHQLLEVRRPEDQGNDLWTTFNVIQENVIRGGITGVAANGRNYTTRPITQISRNVSLNRGMWDLAEGMLAA